MLAPRRWPVRWRLAAVSAGLTLVILIGFAFVVGQLASDRLESDFENELSQSAAALSGEVRIEPASIIAPTSVQTPNLERMAMAEGSAVRIVLSSGEPLRTTAGAPDLGPPRPGIHRAGPFQVATVPVLDSERRVTSLYVQYARTRDDLEATVDRLWLFLACGVIAGTGLAAVAGLWVAGRAMRPIASLTATAREIASTRDPSLRIPKPESSDEVAELAETLDEMLRGLDAARTETEAMVDAQREFVADASHELRTPLTSVLANLELLQERLERTQGSDEDAETVAAALRSSRRMRRLVSDLLLLARADAGRSGARGPVDLAEVAAEAVAEATPMAAGHRLELAAPEPVPLRGNRDELHRLVLNLVENGLRHTPAGSEIEIAAASRNGDAVLEVSDDGPGIPPDVSDRVFSRFVRLADTGAERVEAPADLAADAGSGLGLAIVRAVAEGHGGSVSVGRSETGGARFIVRLPTARATGRQPPYRPFTEPA
jgi:signal transduction histidine kinase